ncbi:DoxX family membrane protein [Caldalkalibacillus mannanilyticus]|uniref:DoxX family membrane protein n=1 Tax=Caldalkalibacillus mannanilyticus TaxID=1418 RepID=UPI000469C51F|nr:DoxX family membrane protein [Caldalkalibacillus mannanilyticus]
MKNKKVGWMLLLCLLIPLVSSAHVKWFTDIDPVKESIENILSPFFLGTSVVVALILGILPQIIPQITNWEISRQMDKRLEEYRHFVYPLLKIGLALALAIQLFSGSIFAPELEVSTFGMYMGVGMILLLLVPLTYTSKMAAVALLYLFLLTVREHGVFYMLDYGFYVAIVFAILVEKTRIQSWGMPFLYLGTGLSLCWVAIEKWVYPIMSLDIIEHHHVPTFGFSPEIFISISAFIEFVVGYLLVVGVLNRLLALVLTLIFITTTTLFGMTEVIGHFMFHIILLIFIIEGVSFYHPPIQIHKSKIDQIIFVSLNFIFVLSTMILIYYRFA